jgi:hypothetical protein
MDDGESSSRRPESASCVNGTLQCAPCVRELSVLGQSLNIAIAVDPLFTVTERDLDAPEEGVHVTL